ncbi:hypothetical protein GQ54DRAFT_31177 [Martensiomyces pterosporus]|nr:hypothetical protein GQ54DRAFT_31177 [Martensiomyces pterosporus]
MGGDIASAQSQQGGRGRSSWTGFLLLTLCIIVRRSVGDGWWESAPFVSLGWLGCPERWHAIAEEIGKQGWAACPGAGAVRLDWAGAINRPMARIRWGLDSAITAIALARALLEHPAAACCRPKNPERCTCAKFCTRARAGFIPPTLGTLPARPGDDIKSPCAKHSPWRFLLSPSATIITATATAATATA